MIRKYDAVWAANNLAALLVLDEDWNIDVAVEQAGLASKEATQARMEAIQLKRQKSQGNHGGIHSTGHYIRRHATDLMRWLRVRPVHLRGEGRVDG